MSEAYPFREIDGVVGRGLMTESRESLDRAVVVKEISPNANTRYFGKIFDPNKEAYDIDLYFNTIDAIEKHKGRERIPRPRCVIGKNQTDQTTLFLVQEEIDGVNLQEIPLDKISDEQKSELESIIVTVLEGYVATYNNTTNLGRALEITKRSNYMLGSSYSQQDKHIFLVDCYPVFHYDPFGMLDRLRIAIHEFGLSHETFSHYFEQLQDLNASFLRNQ